MKFKKLTHFRLVKATLNTLEGIKALWMNEKAFQQEIYLSVLLIPIIFLVKSPSTLKLVLVLLLLLLLAVETLNSALETIVDRISLEYHPQSKIAKDMGSAAVGIVILMNIVAWVYVIFINNQT
jgi:diacylglycerol kinase (ATP)